MKEKDGLPVGTVAWWTNRFYEEKVGVLIEESTLQLYTSSWIQATRKCNRCKGLGSKGHS